jgi:hypothetical protein
MRGRFRVPNLRCRIAPAGRGAALALALAGCAYVAPSPFYPGAVPVDPTVASVGTGAAVGAAVGALIGSTSGDAGAGAAIGAGIGALGGYLADQQRRDRWEDWRRGQYYGGGYYGGDWSSPPYPYAY